MMNIQTLLFVVLFFSSVIGVKRRNCFYRRRIEPTKYSAPFKIDYQLQRNEFEVPNYFDQNSVMLRNPGVGYGLEPRFRSGVADINPMEVSCESSNVTRSLKELKQRVKCLPRDGIVNLKAPEGFMVSPNVVMVKKCGGMCSGAKCCLSKTTRDASFYVRSVNFRTNQVLCTSILVPEDTSCACACETKMTDCLPTQKYDKNMCVCKCINSQDYQNCVKNSQLNFRWDEKTCSCVCSVTKICTTGTHWIPSQCRTGEFSSELEVSRAEGTNWLLVPVVVSPILSFLSIFCLIYWSPCPEEAN